jgi:hypothetical protein
MVYNVWLHQYLSFNRAASAFFFQAYDQWLQLAMVAVPQAPDPSEPEAWLDWVSPAGPVGGRPHIANCAAACYSVCQLDLAALKPANDRFWSRRKEPDIS